MAKHPLPSVDTLRQLLRYEPDTGLLFWLPRGPEWFPNREFFADGGQGVWNRRYAGQEAGGLCQNGYKYISLLKARLLVHRVVWVFETGEWPDVADHLDGDTINNRFENLRSGSQAENMRNARRWAHNRSGVTGVCYDNGNSAWIAYIKVGGRDIRLLASQSFDAAVAARREAEIRYGFSARHGR